MNPTKRIWLSFILILGVGISLSATIFFSGAKVTRVTQDLVRQQFPRLNQIKNLRQALAEQERLLYEYYATTERNVLWPQIQATEIQFHQSLDRLQLGLKLDTSRLPVLYSQIKNLQQQIDNNLAAGEIDWDLARSQLTKLTATGQQAQVILGEISQNIEQQAAQVANQTQNNISLMVNQVIAYAVLVILVAAFVCYYTLLYIKESVRRKELALFPERNPTPVIKLTWEGKIKYANPACSLLLNKLEFGETQEHRLLPENFLTDLQRWQKDQRHQHEFMADLGKLKLQFRLSLFPDLEACHLYIQDITEQYQAQQELEFQAYHDLLSNLPNRRKFELNLAENIKLNKACSLIMIAIDRFEFITSSQGYGIGDRLIKSMGARLQQLNQAHEHPQLYRLDGTTFCILLQSCNPAEGQLLAEKIQQSMDTPLQVSDHPYYLTVSQGLCHFPLDADNTTALISNGHAAVNHAKVHGDIIVTYSEQLRLAEQNWLPIEKGLRHALRNNEFELHYQAKVNATDSRISGAEALIRWKNIEGKMISPGVFIPVAEQTGLIIRIGEWIMQSAFAQAAAWDKAGTPVQVAVNISARQFQHRHFLQQLTTALEITKVNPALIELEITESLIMEHIQQSIDIMHQLREMGFTLAIDDFGTGYSSLSYLKRFPISTLKIDRAFVCNLEEDKDDQNIVSAIIDLAKHLNLRIVAEGVETEGQWRFLQNLNCDYIQGYYFSKPSAPSELFKPEQARC